MPVLEGGAKERTIVSWKGTFVSKYDVYNSKIDMRQLMSTRLQQIAWQTAADLVRSGRYLHGVMDVRVIESGFLDGLDLFFQLLVQPFKDVLGAEDINYWEAKFQERLVFDLMAYASRQIPVRYAPAKVEPSAYVPISLSTEVLKTAEAIQRQIGSLLADINKLETPLPPKVTIPAVRLWNIRRKEKVNG